MMSLKFAKSLCCLTESDDHFLLADNTANAFPIQLGRVLLHTQRLFHIFLSEMLIKVKFSNEDGDQTK
jgi:hypothetical protein